MSVRRWLWSWLTFWKTREEPHDCYRPGKRLIYHYFNGKDMVSADPMTLYRQLVESGIDVSKNLTAFHQAQTEIGALDAYKALVIQVNKVFGIAPYEQGGLTSLETLACWDKFLKYIGWAGGVLPGTRPAATSPPPVGDNPPVAPTSAPETPPAEVPQTAPLPAAENHDAPVVTITLTEDNAALLGQGEEDLSLLQRQPATESSRPTAPVQEANGCGAGTECGADAVALPAQGCAAGVQECPPDPAGGV